MGFDAMVDGIELLQTGGDLYNNMDTPMGIRFSWIV